jgi:hypothetical protein
MVESMRVAAISAGHHDSARGAQHDGVSEYPMTMEWAIALGEALHPYHIQPAIVPSGGLRSKVEFINNLCTLQDVFVAVEIHFNSGPAGRVWGSETLYYPGSHAGEKIAKHVQDSLGAIMPPNRGAKEGWYRMDRPGVVDYHGDVDGDEKPDYFLARTKCPALILEPEFIQNLGTISTNKQMAINAIAKALSEIALGQF